ncbi:hypothetical protein E0H47_05865 [Rhizobium leguminosarum bv. viciae]|nr:hypothetical protein E0H47_05865 [Rhizobium leguminosarum bv. viciae]
MHEFVFETRRARNGCRRAQLMIQRAPAAIRRRLARRTPGGFAANVKWNDFRAKSCGADAAAAGKANHRYTAIVAPLCAPQIIKIVDTSSSMIMSRFFARLMVLSVAPLWPESVIP